MTIRVFGIAATVAMLGGCGGGNQSQLTPSGAFQQSGAQSRLPEGLVDTRMSDAVPAGLVGVRPDQGRSWMRPGAASRDLLYVSNYITSDVFVFSYPDDKLVGTLTGFDQPDGICTDKKGDVFIVSNQNDTIIEYKHGGTSPIATLTDPAGYPVNCSIDPTTGNLAVATIRTYGSGPGSVEVYAHAKGTPKIYYDKKITTVYFVGYDNKGNIFMDGLETGVGFAFAELPKGGKTFTNITLKGGTIYFPGKVFWDGKYVSVADQEYGARYSGTTGIYQTTGAGGKIVSTTPLKGSGDLVDLWLYDKIIIGPDYQDGPENEVLFYKYPAGGNPTGRIKGHGLYEPIGAAISVAQ
ncbi:MAG: hypothetical protein WA814_02810 [Candidatus Baltobacteraceae bacterium]